MQLVDTHCHLDFDVFDEDRNEIIQQALAAGIAHIVIPGVMRNGWHNITALCDQHHGLSACYGLHPYFVGQHAEAHLDTLHAYASRHACVAIGECGLDFRQGQAPREHQLFYFEAQLDIAQRLGKPVVIHAVKATQQVIQSLQDFPGLRGMIHSYSGSYEQALQLIDAGFVLGFGGAVTHPRARRLHDLIRRLPLTSMLLETDAPDQAPSTHHGQRNQPAWLRDILDTIAVLRMQDKTEIAHCTTANADELFGLNLTASAPG